MKCQYWVLLLLVARGAAGQALPGTAPLTDRADLAAEMVDGINEYLLRATAESIPKRGVAKDRERFKKIIGAVDPRVPVTSLTLQETTTTKALVASGQRYKAYSVRWPVLDGVSAEGLLLEPEHPVARIVAIPDADWSPEMLAGIAAGVDASAQFARRLAENGCQVLIPVILDRKDTWSGIPGVRMTNQPHREWIYRMAYETGRHIIGYEVQKVLAGVDWFTHENNGRAVPIGVAGYGEGGLLALYSAAADPRIGAVAVSGYFQSRQDVWREPVYRDVWGLLHDFGDAEIASLIAPRALIVEASRGPRVDGPPPATKERSGATPNGKLSTPALDSVRAEFERARPFFAADKVRLVVSADGEGQPGSEAALDGLLQSLGVHAKLKPSETPLKDVRRDFDPSPRMHRQFDEMVSYTQMLVRRSPGQRAKFWAKADASTPERWKESTRFYRDYIWDEVIGRMPAPNVAPNPRTRLIYDQRKFRGYEVVLDVWPGVFAYGILNVPKGIQPGEKRPVVVCQHGLEGRPSDAADPNLDSHYYHRFAAKLADEGFITYSPQNPYIFQDRFRLIQRKGHPLKLSLFSFILGQHQRALEFLSGQPFVDASRIGFYGLSYGGKTAVRVPPFLDGYALSICSGDFNEWVWKTTSVESPYSYMVTQEYDMIEFDFANITNYSDLANLMAPRPFMVERGHNDGVAPDEWVAYEYSKVRRFYDTKMNLPGATTIEFFTGPHTIHGEGTFEFLRKHLRWPQAQ